MSTRVVAWKFAKSRNGTLQKETETDIFFLARLKSKVNVRSLAKSNISPKSRQATIENQVLKEMRVSAGCKKDRGWLQKGRQENCIFMGRPPRQGGRARQTGYITWKVVAKTCTFRNLQIVERYWVFLDARSIFHRQERFMKRRESISVGASYCVGPFQLSPGPD